MLVLLEDAVVLGYCRRGCREFALRHGLDWDKFRTEGLDSSVFESIDDAMVADFLAQACRREGGMNGVE